MWRDQKAVNVDARSVETRFITIATDLLKSFSWPARSMAPPFNHLDALLLFHRWPGSGNQIMTLFRELHRSRRCLGWRGC